MGGITGSMERPYSTTATAFWPRTAANLALCPQALPSLLPASRPTCTPLPTTLSASLNDNNEFAYLERSGTFFPSYELFWQRPDGTPPRNILQYPSPPWSRVILNMNNLGQLPYSQKHQTPSTGLFYESFFTFGSQPIIQRMALDNSVNEGGWYF